jgi:membrane fusion protein, multidrug efflux system
MNKYRILPTGFLIAAVTVVMISCKQKNIPVKIADDAVPVRERPVQFTDYRADLQYSGLLASTSETKLSFKIGGIISKIFVKEGDHVSKGQILAVLDLTEINAQVQQTQQANEKAKRDEQRVKNLFADTAATLEQVQNVQTQSNVTNQNLRIAQFNKQYAQIKATETGTIIKKTMSEGEMAAPGAPVFIINGTSNSNWVVRFGVSDKEWAALSRGDAATIEIDAYPDAAFKGVINKMAEAADPQSGTYEIEVKVLPGGKKFAAGLFSTIHIKSNASQKVAMIPIEALAEADAKTGYVYVLNKDRKTVSKKKVTIAFISNDRVAVKNGLEGTDSVITDGLSYLNESSLVKVENN